ncbi:deoxyribodipyrimidine photo-lyase [Pedobacter steynii]|uniref:Cryptochrome DASH n=1 Tax=Pedobacter steynii TaxID=430522 RepID=A0A1G9X1U2_9SPHI|nr:DASH family cryptochrome [Pedobacter steynii]NQX40461.1 DASH family cryptochrome [Pedobacter steynii]SDM90699.1 deoxyribodipyrimidine photo-lyase [Pedobacter steynii]
MKSKRILVWFRNDLRLHDNEMLVEAIAKSDSILPVYFFDPHYFQPTIFETDKTGVHRAKFLLESVAALRMAFQKLGGDVLLMMGSPEELMARLVEDYEISEVYHHREVAPEETLISTKVEDLLWKLKINLKHFIGHTLYNKEDLPFPIKDIPDVFAQFKKKTERDAIVKSCFLSPEEISFVENEDWGLLPSLEDLGFDAAIPIPEQSFSGGEDAGLEHLKALLEEGADIYLKPVKHSPDKPGFSSRLSGWLSLGCLSPRKVYWLVKEAEATFGGNANFNQILLGLLWRDYFRFMFKKHGIEFFQEADFEKELFSVADNENPALQKWKAGNTGHAMIDKYMHELNEFGFIPHTGRLLVATFLVHVLKVHWTNGAIYFEDKLIDYAPASNWGNWANVAGVGKDAKSKNSFDLDKQIKILETAVSDAASMA